MSEFRFAWSELVAVAARRERLILRVFGGGLVMTLLVIFGLPTAYRATATLMVTATRSRSISPDAEAVPLIDRVTEEDLNAQAELIKSPDLLRDVLSTFADEGRMLERGPLSRMVSFFLELPDTIHDLLHGTPLPTPLDEWVKDMAKRLDVDVVKKTSLIEVSYRQRSIDPQWASDFVNALVDKALAQQQRINQQDMAMRFFADQRAELEGRVRSAEAAQRSFYVREGLDSLPEQRTLWRTRLTELTTAAQNQETESAAAAARVQSLETAIKKTPERVAKEVHLAQNQAVQFIKNRFGDDNNFRGVLGHLKARNHIIEFRHLRLSAE